MTAHIEGYDVAIEVARSGAGTYEIPGAAEPEDWHQARTDGDLMAFEDHGPLEGWGAWERVVSAADSDGRRRWYFLAPEWPPCSTDPGPICVPCRDSRGERVAARWNVPQSTDQGRTVERVNVCDAHKADWWEGADWDGRALARPLMPGEWAYTPEPWAVRQGAVYSAGMRGVALWYANTPGDGEPVRIAIMDREEPGTRPTERDANARRAVSCVNACRGIRDPDADGVLALDDVTEAFAHTLEITPEAHRKALRIAAQRIAEYARETGGSFDDDAFYRACGLPELAEPLEPGPRVDEGGADTNPSHRNAMRDAGRGRQLR